MANLPPQVRPFPISMGPVLFPKPIRGSPQLIAMVHVPSNNALSNTVYNDLFGKIGSYSVEEVDVLDGFRVAMEKLVQNLYSTTGLHFEECRSAVFLLNEAEVQPWALKVRQMGFVQRLIERALAEVDTFVAEKISFIEVENVGAPYCMGNQVPWEDLMILHLVCLAIRQRQPTLFMGVHVLSGNEYESLPIAIASRACFVRSETTIFSGQRPEGFTQNRGNLAKFFQMRNYLHAKRGVVAPRDRRWPQVWSDFQKKHTVFPQELSNLDTWLQTICFCKVEGVIITGPHTGSNVAEDDLKRARAAIEGTLQDRAKWAKGAGIPEGDLPVIPLLTGSGFDVQMYAKYADFLIVGTQLKEQKYWENEVSRENVQEVLRKIKNPGS